MSRRLIIHRAINIGALMIAMTAVSTHMRADTGTCSGQTITVPFTDVAGSIFFCSIAEAYFSGLTNGTSPTTYSPSQNVPRDQMAAFITRAQDAGLRRIGRRAALEQWGQGSFSTSGTTNVDDGPHLPQSDGTDIWVPNATSGTISRVHGSDGKLLGTWTGAQFAVSIVVARGRIYAAGSSSPGKLYRFDPRQAPQDVTIVTSSLGDAPQGITADESFIWTANQGGSVSRFNPLNSAVTTFQAGFQGPLGILYDGANIWVTDIGDNTLKKLNSNGTVNQSIPMGLQPNYPVFDGTNIWVPNYRSNSVTVVRVKDPQGNPLAQPFVLATLTGNGLDHPVNVAFDGQRILVTDFFGDAVSLWRATDLTPLGLSSSPSNSGPYGTCSDGVNFWVTLVTTNKLARF